jgi:glycosyltransferase involved in cell wall biosynthesis
MIMDRFDDVGDGYFLDPRRVRTISNERLMSALVPMVRRLVLGRLPPGAWRSFVHRVLYPFAAIAQGAASDNPVCVAGFLSALSGIGEGGRLAAKSLSLIGYDVLTVDLTNMFGYHGLATRNLRGCPLGKGTGTVIFHFNPDDLALSLIAMGRRRLIGKRVIGYWAWELPTIPHQWIHALKFVDEIWTPSQFVASAIVPFTDKMVRVVPHPVAAVPSGETRRDDFDISADKFVVLTMFSLSSSFDRKNPLAAIAAFRMAFGEDLTRILILKISDLAQYPTAANMIREAIAEAPNIRVMEANLSSRAARNLIASADVVLSLHRSEGFGLVMAEAMHSGTAVIATSWSGNLDFMNEDTACLVPVVLVPVRDSDGYFDFLDERWAEPNVAIAAQWLKFLAENPAARHSLQQRAKNYVAERLGLEAFKSHVGATLRPFHGACRR